MLVSMTTSHRPYAHVFVCQFSKTLYNFQYRKCQYTRCRRCLCGKYLHVLFVSFQLKHLFDQYETKKEHFQFQFVHNYTYLWHAKIETKTVEIVNVFEYLTTLTVVAHCEFYICAGIPYSVYFDLHERENLRSLHYCWLVAHQCDCLWLTFS